MQNIDVFGLFDVNCLYVILGLIVVIIALFILQIINLVKIKRMRVKHNAFMSGKDGISLEEAIQTRFNEIDSIKSSIKKHGRQLDNLNKEMLSVYNKTGIVKYDAFNEMGGKLSFALCMLDKSNNGYVINAMHSREGCYTYIKEIVHGESFITLGDEEKEALDKAVNNDKTE